jgi:hypothetical protein
MAKKKLIDWTFIKPLWCSSGLSNCEIVKQYNEAHKDQEDWSPTVSEAAIRKRAKNNKQPGGPWKRQLAGEVKRKALEKLVRKGCESRTDEDILDQAAEGVAEIIRLHRNDIANLKQLELDIIRRIVEDEEQIVIVKYRGSAFEHKVKMGLEERTRVYHRLVAAINLRIRLENIAWGITDDDGDLDKPESVSVEQYF